MSQPAVGQSHDTPTGSIEVQDAPLGRVLERLATDLGISLVYDFTLVEGRTATCRQGNTTPDVLLRCLLKGHPIEFDQTSKGTYVLRKTAQAEPLRGTISGVVRAKDQGRPLPFAHVRLPEAERFAGTVTDSTGHFELTGLTPGSHTVVVTRVGYGRHEAEVFVPPNADVHHEAALALSPIRGDSVIVDGNRSWMALRRRGDGRLSAAQILRSDGRGTPDVLAAASTLLGVTASAPYADLHIQGGNTGGHTLRLDGAPIRNPVSMGRLLGAFSPLALDGVTAVKAGFGVLRGNSLSGTIELNHDLSERSTDYGTLRIDPRSANARVHGSTTVDGTPVTAMVSTRTSMWNLYQDGALNNLINQWSALDPVLAGAKAEAAPVLNSKLPGGRAKPNAGFYDVHAAARAKFGPSERVYVSGYHGGTRLGADLVGGQRLTTRLRTRTSGTTDPSLSGSIALPTHDEYAWSNTAAQIRYETLLTPWTAGTVQASISHYRGETQSTLNSPGGTIGVGTGGDVLPARLAIYGQEGANEITEFNFEGRIDTGVPAVGGGLTVKSGLTFQGSHFRIGNAFAPRLRHRTRTVRVTSAAEMTMGLGKYATFEGGARMTVVPLLERLFIEPRGSLYYDRGIDGLGAVAVRIGGGLYRQFTTQLEISRDGAMAVVPTTHVWLPITSSIASSRAYHLAATATWEPSSEWRATLEGYRKWQPHMVAIDYPALRNEDVGPMGAVDPSAFLGSSQGYSYGAGVRLEYDGSVATTALRYGYSQTKRTFPNRFNDRTVPVPWTEPHRLTLRAHVPIGAGIAIEADGEGVWGRKWGYRRAYYAYLTASDFGEAWSDIRLDRPESHTLPPLYRLDLGLSVSQSWSGVDVKGRVGVENILNRANVADWTLRPQGHGEVHQGTRTLPGRRGTISIEVGY